MPRVAVLVDTATDWGRGIIKGIHRYSREKGPWHLFFEARGLDDPVVLAPEWQGQGIIARVPSAATARQLGRQGLPVVNVSSIHYAGPQFPSVSNDVEGVARLAVSYFRQRGFQSFAYFSYMGLEYVSRQREAFVQAAEAAGGSVAVHSVALMPGFQTPDWNLNLDKLGAWLLALPKPVAICTWSGGREIIHACQKVGLLVPQEVALLSGAEDELHGGLAPIPISGVKADSERIGYEAASQLAGLMHGGAPTPTSRMIPPLGVVTRQSTDTLAITDTAIRKALHFIYSHLSTDFNVTELARVAGISRSSLERRFRGLLGLPPAEYVAHLRLEHVKKLLSDSTMSVAAVAEKAGFASPEYLTTVFRRSVGTSPLLYRRALLTR